MCCLQNILSFWLLKNLESTRTTVILKEKIFHKTNDVVKFVKFLLKQRIKKINNGVDIKENQLWNMYV